MPGKISEQEMQITRWAVFRQDHIATESTGGADDALDHLVANIALLYRIDEDLFGNFLFAMDQAVHPGNLLVQVGDPLHRLDLALQQEAVIGLDQEIIATGIDTGL